MTEPQHFMVLDCESIGLHGEAFAYGWVIIDRDGNTLREGLAHCFPDLADGSDDDRAWVKANCGGYPFFGDQQHTDLNPIRLRDRFWGEWKWAQQEYPGIMLAADVCWPVEASFLSACVSNYPEARKWDGPYPMVDVAVMRMAAGLDPLATTERLPHELPAHHPLNDARQSARLLAEALKRCDHLTTYSGE